MTPAKKRDSYFDGVSKLLKEGKVILDPSYTIDKNGKARITEVSLISRKGEDGEIHDA